MLVQLEKRLPPLPQPSVPVALKCEWERPTVCGQEVLALSRRWAAELGETPFDPNWDYIFAMERANSAMVWTAPTPSVKAFS